MKTRNGKIRGFTLVELLVVISIIGMLMAMLLPAVQSARESARGNTCRNNMRNLALAIVQYESAREKYPGYRNDLNASLPSGTPNRDRSWTFVLLPYMDHRSVYDQFVNYDAAGVADPEGTPNASITLSLEVTTCPSNPPENTAAGATSFVVNSGQIDGTASATRPADFQANGVFHENSAAGVARTVSRAAYIASYDGLGTTIMMSENADANSWIDTDERFAGFTYSGTVNPPVAIDDTNPLGINALFSQSKKTVPQDTDRSYTRPSAFHPNGVNVVFCDSHVRFISDSISYQVFQALMSARGTNAVLASNGNALPAGHGAPNIVDEASLN